MKIRTRLAIAVLIPLVAAMSFGAMGVWSSWKGAGEMRQVAQLAELSTQASALVHELQKERGLTAGYLGAKSDDFRSRLVKQQETTDGQLKSFHEFLARMPSQVIEGEFQAALQESLTVLDALGPTREKVLGDAIAAPEAIGFYTGLNERLLNAVGRASTIVTNGVIATRIDAFNALMKSKERAGLERAVLSNTFAQDRFSPGCMRSISSSSHSRMRT